MKRQNEFFLTLKIPFIEYIKKHLLLFLYRPAVTAN